MSTTPCSVLEGIQAAVSLAISAPRREKTHGTEESLIAKSLPLPVCLCFLAHQALFPMPLYVVPVVLPLVRCATDCEPETACAGNFWSRACQLPSRDQEGDPREGSEVTEHAGSV